MAAGFGLFALLILAGLLAFIIFAIVRKQWALLLIPVLLALLYIFPAFITHQRKAPAPDSRAYNSQYSHSDSDYQTIDSQVRNGQPSSAIPVSKPKQIFSVLPIILLIFIALSVFRGIKTKNWALLYIPAGLVLFLVAIAFLREGRRVQVHEAFVREYPINKTAITPALNESDQSSDPLPAVWSTAMEDEYKADTYYSIDAAIRQIAKKINKSIDQMILNGKQMPNEIILLGLPNEKNQQIIDQAIKVFTSTMPKIVFNGVEAGSRIFNSEDYWVSFDISQGDASLNYVYVNDQLLLKPEDFVRGSITASIYLQSLKTSESVSFVTKPWLKNFSLFQNSLPHRQFSVAYSQSACRNLDRAKREALSQAQRIVYRMISERLDFRQHLSNISLSSEDLYNHRIIIDSFTQSLQSHVGIYRQAILLDISPDKIYPLVEAKIKRNRTAMNSWAQMIASAIGVAIIICVIYLILNAATKGYYTAVLRILTVAGIIAAVALLLI